MKMNILETVYCFLSIFLIIPSIKGKEIVRPKRIKLIIFSVIFVANFITLYLDIFLKSPSFLIMNLSEFGSLLDCLHMLSALIGSVLTQVCNNKLFYDIAKALLSYRHLIVHLKLCESIIVLVSFLFTSVFIMFLYTGTFVWMTFKFPKIDMLTQLFKMLVELCNYYFIRMFLHHVKVLRCVFLDINSKLKELFPKDLSSNKAILDNQCSKKLLNNLASIHSTGCNLICKINVAYSPQILFILAKLFTSLIYLLFYQVCFMLFNPFSLEQLQLDILNLFFFLAIACNVLIWLEIAWTCRITSYEVRYFRNILLLKYKLITYHFLLFNRL